jgi:hypothetical protein
MLNKRPVEISTKILVLVWGTIGVLLLCSVGMGLLVAYIAKQIVH